VRIGRPTVSDIELEAGGQLAQAVAGKLLKNCSTVAGRQALAGHGGDDPRGYLQGLAEVAPSVA